MNKVVVFFYDKVIMVLSQNNEAIMKAIRAERIKIKVGDLWASPLLHVLITKEDDVIVARCLDFTISSHGKDEKDALK